MYPVSNDLTGQRDHARARCNIGLNTCFNVNFNINVASKFDERRSHFEICNFVLLIPFSSSGSVIVPACAHAFFEGTSYLDDDDDDDDDDDEWDRTR